MPHAFDVEVVASDRKVYSGQAVSVTLPAADGYMGVLYGHAPLVTTLKIGEVTITPAGGQPEILLAVAGGFADVTPDHVTILADAAEEAAQIDIERARLSRERAEERLRIGGPDVDYDRAAAALMRALNRLRVAGGASGGSQS